MPLTTAAFWASVSVGMMSRRPFKMLSMMPASLKLLALFLFFRILPLTLRWLVSIPFSAVREGVRGGRSGQDKPLVVSSALTEEAREDAAMRALRRVACSVLFRGGMLLLM